MPNQIRNALILPADWKVEAPRCAPGETEVDRDDDGAADQEPEAKEGDQDQA